MPENKSETQRSLPEPTWAVGGLVIAWGLLISQTRHHWGGESYYNFGFFVPPLAIWLFLRNLSKINDTRWSSSFSRPVNSRLDPLLHQEWLYIVLAGVTLLPMILFHALSEVNPFWRVPLWAQGFCLCGFTMILLFRYYGWAGIRAGLFPLIFLITMIPWPFRFEVWIVQTLTGIVTTFAVDGLHFLSYPVEMAGNTLRLGEISIGVNEACSGIRSLQALFMVTLFLGSLFGQSLVSRLLALAVLPLVVIVVNTLRAIFLSVQTIVNGQEAYEGWHDPAGYIAFGVRMAIIYVTIELFNIGAKATDDSQKVDLKLIGSHWAGGRAHKRSLPYLVIPLITLILSEGWFRYHEWQFPEQNIWEFAIPMDSDPNYKEADFDETVIDMLGFSYGHHFYYKLSQNALLDVYYYGYDKDNRIGSASSYAHSPIVCMGATGSSLVEEYPVQIFRKDRISLPVKHYKFQLGSTNNEIQVFWIFNENRNMNIDPEMLHQTSLEPMNLKSNWFRTMWEQLRKGRRDYSRTVLLISCLGIDDPDVASQKINDFLQERIILEKD